MKRVGKWLTVIVVVCSILLLGILFLPKMIGLQPLVILNDSMSPTYKEGSLLYLKDAEHHRIKVGDPVVIQLARGEYILQRITKIEDDNKNMTAKADALETEHEQFINSEQIIGIPAMTIPYAGYVAVKLNTPLGKGILIGAILSVFSVSFIPDIINKKKIQ